MQNRGYYLNSWGGHVKKYLPITVIVLLIISVSINISFIANAIKTKPNNNEVNAVYQTFVSDIHGTLEGLDEFLNNSNPNTKILAFQSSLFRSHEMYLHAYELDSKTLKLHNKEFGTFINFSHSMNRRINTMFTNYIKGESINSQVEDTRNTLETLAKKLKETNMESQQSVDEIYKIINQ